MARGRSIPRLLVLSWVIVAFAACSDSGRAVADAFSGDGGGGVGEAGAGTIKLTGRVVDFESCSAPSGCQGVAQMRVALFYDRNIASGLTQASGAFTLKNVPNGVRTYLYVSDASGKDRYLSTLQGNVVTTEGKSIHTVETYAIARDKALYRSIGKEIGAEAGRDGIYVGLALNRETQNLRPVAGASVTITPTMATVRFYKANLDLEPGAKEAFFPETWTSTGIQGLFVGVAGAAVEDYSILALTADKKDFTPVLAPVGKGFVTLGLHYVSDASP
ncbi:MAG: hypothetical protein KAI47_27490 [Deltaproteobacteria bacterium]|nr:hypothetical protein [Deltaproteobacteria bacterium]